MTNRTGMIAAKIGGGLACIGALAAGVMAVTGAPGRSPAVAASSPARPSVSTVQPVAVVKPVATPIPEPVDAGLVVKRVLTIDGPFRHGDYVWDAEGITEGPLVITVDLKAQTMSVFRGGYEIGAAVILYGADDSQSPLGVFPITEKDADHVSNLYDAPMPYMLRLTNDGVAIHGSDVELDAATRGCIGVPTPFAKLLFAQAKRGDRVIITNGERLELGGRITAV